MGGAYLCAEAGISNAVVENQAAYVAGWLKKLVTRQRAVRLGQKSDRGALLDTLYPLVHVRRVRDITAQKEQVFLGKAIRELEHCGLVCRTHQPQRNRPDLRLATRPYAQKRGPCWHFAFVQLNIFRIALADLRFRTHKVETSLVAITIRSRRGCVARESGSFESRRKASCSLAQTQGSRSRHQRPSHDTAPVGLCRQ